MKQTFTPITDSGHRSRVSYLNGNGRKIYKVLFLFWLAAFAIINSSFTTGFRQSNGDKTSPVKKAVPFKGQLSVSMKLGVTSGTGVASHTGIFEYVSVDDNSAFPFVTGTATLTAANGDEIFTRFSGYLDPLGNDMLSVSFENSITGGTGRFEGATGSFTSTGNANASTGTANTTFTGTISY